MSRLPLRSLRGATITGLGMYVPKKILTNHDLAQMVDTNDQWIIDRTGIRERHIAAPEEATSDLAVRAAREALCSAHLSPETVDLLIVATSTGDTLGFPATAAFVQEKLGATRAAAFDVSAVCSGFTYALDVAVQYIQTGRYDRVLVIGAETNSRFVDWTDRSTCVLFGDGAGAVVLEPAEYGAEGVLVSILGSDGSGAGLLNIPAGGSRLPMTPELLAEHKNTIYQNGREVYRFAVEKMGEAALEAVAAAGLSPADVDLLIPHQANIRIIASAAKRMDLPMEKVVINLDRYGNTSAATIPIAMAEAWQEGRILPGMILVTVGFGAGLSWGANVIRWGNLLPPSRPQNEETAEGENR
ncbi:MAG: beta-ketoacyl-ACP synthase III [Capsulimonadales bacterium]|nr:beta-ketoacyl-ACP synthase III [Capsulimonadales bacterium]